MAEAGAEYLRRLAPQVLGAVVRRYGHFYTAEDAVQEVQAKLRSPAPVAASAAR
jgi:DNA-directed RNA polymerase specialized sigma24 family protein